MVSRGSLQQKGHCGVKERVGTSRHALGSLVAWPLSGVMLNAAGATRGGEALPLTRVGVTEFLPWPEHFSFVHNHSIAFPTLVQKDGSSFTFLMPLHSAIRLISSSTQDTPNVQGPGRISAAFHEHCCFWVPPSWIQSHNLTSSTSPGLWK